LKESNYIMIKKIENTNKFNTFCTSISNNLANNIKYRGICGNSYYLDKIVNCDFYI